MRARAVLAMMAALAALAFGPVPAGAVPGLQEGITIDLAWPIAQNVSPNPVQYFQVPIYINYQRAVAPQWCLAIIPSVTFYVDKPPIGTVMEFKPWVEVEYHPDSTGLGGAFIGVTAMFGAAYRVTDSWSLSWWYAGVGPVIGYQLLLPFNLMANFAFAAVYGPGSASPGMNYRLEVGIGWRF